MSARGPVIEIENATRRFGSITAVDQLSLAIRENEFFALLGPSGCGKTTLLRMIAGFEQPDEGRIRLDGADITDVRPNRRPVNMMFQSYALFPHLSVAANVAYGLEMEGVKGTELKRRVTQALEMVQLGEQAGRKPQQLSGGQRQRVALARALIKRPRVLLLDEPLAALDKKLREQMQLELKRLQHETGITFLVVTHDQEEALVMADRIALLNHGRIAQLDTPKALYEHPASRFVADFIGVMNFLPGRLAAGGVVEVAGLGSFRGTLADGTIQAPGTPATLAVRPERVRVALAKPAALGDNAVGGRVKGIAYMGQDLMVHAAVAGLGAPLIARLGAGSEAAVDLAEGVEVWCDWPAAHARILMD
jgi:spermidine/putrescine ABC transporter ATP-binding subunit